MTSAEVRKRFLTFFEKRGHTIVPSSPLVPENDPSVLFTTAGMQQFKPYYTGEKNAEKDFNSKNTASSQKCVRTNDIDEVGDNTHLTFFEMLGNFSFGGYEREDAITYGHDFITKELGLTISYVTFYKGNEHVPRDDASRKLWEKLGVKDIREDGSDVFWGPTGTSGPCGPTTEIYCKNAEGQDVEIWNIVFNEYFCDGSREMLDKGQAKLSPLATAGIDTGMGLERLLATVQKKKNVFETDLFDPVIELIKKSAKNVSDESARIIADHVRTATFLIADGVLPSNKDQGYVLRRLLRRAIFRISTFAPEQDLGVRVIEWYVKEYVEIYANLDVVHIVSVFKDEENKFIKTLAEGKKELEKGTDAFILWTTYGFPVELTRELGTVDIEDFNKKMKEHQDLSRASSEVMFKGGLGDTSEMSVRYHTATHLLHQALRDVLGKEVSQKGSNITPERLRFDFSFSRKMTDEEKKKVEDIVNEKIKAALPVHKIILPKAEAEKTGALHFFGDKYGDQVSIYFTGDSLESAYSKEFCGGPHVANTAELGTFKIQKEEAVSAGVRRIKAILV